MWQGFSGHNWWFCRSSRGIASESTKICFPSGIGSASLADIINWVLCSGRCQHHRAQLDMTDHKLDRGATTDHPTRVHWAVFCREKAERDKCLHFVPAYHAWCVSCAFCLCPAPAGEMFPCRGVSKGAAPLPCSEPAGHSLSLLPHEHRF